MTAWKAHSWLLNISYFDNTIALHIFVTVHCIFCNTPETFFGRKMLLRRLTLSNIKVVHLNYIVLMKIAPLSVSHSIVDSIPFDSYFVKFELLKPFAKKIKKIVDKPNVPQYNTNCSVDRPRTCTSGSVVEYRLAKARVAGSNPVLRLPRF